MLIRSWRKSVSVWEREDLSPVHLGRMSEEKLNSMPRNRKMSQRQPDSVLTKNVGNRKPGSRGKIRRK